MDIDENQETIDFSDHNLITIKLNFKVDHKDNQESCKVTSDHKTDNDSFREYIQAVENKVLKEEISSVRDE